MKISNEGLSVAKAKVIDMVDYLSSIGYHPAKISRQNYWYFSPFRDETNPSFKVNRNLNRWYDFAEGKGGNLVDFGIRYNQCSVNELLHQLSGNFPVYEHPPLPKRIGSLETQDSPIKILKEEDIHSFALLRYLHLRRIPIAIAQQYCTEITYELHNKKYYAIGFKNDTGGYELRNEYFKGSSSPKDITLMDKGAKEMAVFEGFFNFLSYQAIHQKLDPTIRNFLILNSVSFFEKAKPVMLQQETVHLYLDRDTTGQNYTQKALALGDRFKDESPLYQGHKDLNDWIKHIGKSQKQGFHQQF